jgi:hypothetical protein
MGAIPYTHLTGATTGLRMGSKTRICCPSSGRKKGSEVVGITPVGNEG